MFNEVKSRCVVEATACKGYRIIEEIHRRDRTVFAAAQVASKSFLCEERICWISAAAEIECFVLTQMGSAIPLYKDRCEVVMIVRADGLRQWIAKGIRNSECKTNVCNRGSKNFWAF